MDGTSASPPPSPGISNSPTLKKALELINKATEEDKNRNYEEAARLYHSGVEYLLYALRYEPLKEKTTEKIRERVSVYVERCEKIEKYLEKKYQREKLMKLLRKENSEEEGEEEVLSDLIHRLSVVEKPNVKWCNVFGLSEAKETLQEALIMPLKFPQLFNSKRRPWNSVLLYGPQGVGKTLLAHALATEVNSTFIPLSICLEESERLFKNLSMKERSERERESSTIIFIDEIDVLFNSKSADKTKAKLLTYMKDTIKESDRVLILATANEPWNIEDVLLKRFEKKIYTPLPSTAERLQILKFCLCETPHLLTEANLEDIAKKTEGYAGGDISVLVQEALMQPIRKLKTATHYKIVSGSSLRDPNVVSHDMLTPCSPGCIGAMEMSWEEVPRDKILEPLTNMSDMLCSVLRSKPTSKEYDVERYEYFQKYSC